MESTASSSPACTGAGSRRSPPRSPSNSNGRGISYAAIDLDWLTSERIFLDNLAGVVGNYLRAGVRHVVLAGAVGDRRALEHIAGSMPVPLR